MRNWLVYGLVGIVFFLVGCQAQTEIVLKPIDQERTYTEAEAEAVQDVLEQRLNGLDLTEVSINYTFQGDIPYFTISGAFDREGTVQEIVSLSTGVALLEFVDYAGLPRDILVPASIQDACIVTTYQVELGLAEIDANGTASSSLCENPIGLEDGQLFSTIMSNEGLAEATASINQYGTYNISFVLTDGGAKIFEAYTAANIGQPLAIVINGQVISAPTINGVISGGEGQISGDFTQEEVESLVLQLNLAVLTIPLELVEINEGGGLNFFE